VHRECRYCGSIGRLRLVEGLALCDDCANSPLCDRCGHPRRDHTHVFVRGVAVGCGYVSFDFQALATSGCDCEGFAPVRGRLRDAGFVAGPDPLELGLRRPGHRGPRSTM
jgi:hypothetical protein